MKQKHSKILLYALVAIALLYFTNDFGLIDIERTAIIVALGIDYEKETEEYTVTAQIAMPQSSAEKTVNNQDSNIESKGNTVAKAIENLGIITGWYPMLNFCELVILGENLLENNVMDVLSYFMRSDKVPDSAILSTCEGTAKEVLSSCAALDELSAFSIEKVISDTQKSEEIAVTNVKEFIQSYFSKSNSSFMPMIKTIKGIKKEDDSSKEEKNKEGGSDKCVYDTTTTCLFNGGIYCGKLDKSETLIFNLFLKDSHKTVITVENTTVENKKCNVLLNINKAKTSSKVITEKVLPIFEVKMDVVFKIDDINTALDKESLLPIQEIPQNILNDAETKIKTSIENIFEKAKEYDCDIFKLKERLYKYNYDDYEKLKDDILQNVILDLTVNCYSFKK